MVQGHHRDRDDDCGGLERPGPVQETPPAPVYFDVLLHELQQKDTFHSQIVISIAGKFKREGTILCTNTSYGTQAQKKKSYNLHGHCLLQNECQRQSTSTLH